MKTYMVFAYDGYYPSGGVNDFMESFDDLSEAKDLCVTLNTSGGWDFTQVFNTITEEVVYEG